MNFTTQSKSNLAKLMATENLTVEHRKVQTASFDLKNRVLTCPIWAEMSPEMYDLLLGHEIGHALETPLEGWHDTVLENSRRNFKYFLNVIEDARIEKKIKRRFPGLRPSFVKAYGELIEKDFFGIKNRNVNTLPFIDRINLHTKAGYTTNIRFSEKEMSMLKLIEECETFADVKRVTEIIYEYAKKEKQEEKQKPIAKKSNDDYIEIDDSNDGYTDSDDSDDEESDDEDYGDDEESDDEDYGDEFIKKSEDDSDDEESDEEGSTYDNQKYSSDFNSDENKLEEEDEEPRCITDENFRKNEIQLLDPASRSYQYINIPEPIMKNIFTDAKLVNQGMMEFWKISSKDLCKSITVEEVQQKLLKMFKSKNDKFISALAKEFEMRKAATKYAKKKISEMGEVDVNKIYKYKVEDNIFRKMSSIPKGKSHGLVIMLDRSGSMSNDFNAAVEQILITVSFCRKVNIPFVVCGFGNDSSGFVKEHKLDNKLGASFELNNNDLIMDHVFLREYMNSSMSNSEFNQAFKNLLFLSTQYNSDSYRECGWWGVPHTERLSNTPLIQGMVGMKKITENFRIKNRLDIVNMVLVHDGDADQIRFFNSADDRYAYVNSRSFNTILRDPKTKFEIQVSEKDDGLREAIFEWFTKTTGAKIIGFYLTDLSRMYNFSDIMRNKFIDENGKSFGDYIKKDEHNKNKLFEWNDLVKKYRKQIKQDHFLEINTKGYTKFFLIPSGKDLQIADDEIQINGPVTNNKLFTAFKNMNKDKRNSRVLVGKFIKEIA